MGLLTVIYENVVRTWTCLGWIESTIYAAPGGGAVIHEKSPKYGETVFFTHHEGC